MRATHTVEAIIEAAARILETLGFEGYTTNSIAERAGVSIGSLYQYFPNKDAITLALISRETATLLAEIREASAIQDWKLALNAMVDAAVRHQLRRPKLARLLDLEEARLPAADETVPESNTIYASVQEVVAKAKFPAADLGELTADIIGITRGMTDMAGRMKEVDIEALAARVRRSVFNYLLGD